MRNPALHDQLRAIAGQAAERLSDAVAAGAEIPFEVAENPGARSVLYHYQPLSAQFVRERFPGMRDLPAFDPAIGGLAAVEGASAYLRVLGAGPVPVAPGDRAEVLLREFLARLWTECGSFEVDEQRFERAYAELEVIAYEDSVVNAVVAPLVGVRLAAERWELGSGLSLVRGDLSDAPPEAVWASGRDDEDPNTIAVLTVESTPQDPPPLTEARLSFRRLLSAVRLHKPGAAALGPHAWWRTDDGPWQAVPLGLSGRSRGNPCWLEPHEQAELKELFELLRARPATGSLPWALARFEAGCEHPFALDGLSDHLLAARALLEGAEPSPIGVSLRMGALCGEPAERRAVQRRVEQAYHLERLVMRGDADAALIAAAGIDAPEALARDLEADLRALLRDAVCGHLPVDLRSVADEILDETAKAAGPESAQAGERSGGWRADMARALFEPTERRGPPADSDFVVRRTRPEPAVRAAARTGRAPAESPAAESPAAESPAAESRNSEPPAAEPLAPRFLDPDDNATEEHPVVPAGSQGAAAASDRGFDDDAADYSAAV